MGLFNKITIGQYRGLNDITLDEMGDFNIILGNNNAGKTSILEAVSCWRTPDRIDNVVRSSILRISSKRLQARGSAFDAFVNIFPYHSGNKTIKLSSVINGERHHLEIDGVVETRFLQPVRLSRSFSDGDAEEKEQSEIEVECFSGVLKNNDSTIEVLVRSDDIRAELRELPLMPINFISSAHHLTNSVVTKNLLPHKEEITKLLTMFDVNITGFDLAYEESGWYPTEMIHHKYFAPVPLSTFGDGLKRVLGLAGQVLMSQNGLLLIDEIDTSIHISVLADVFKWFVSACKQYNVQVLATTHSLETVRSIVNAVTSDEACEMVVYRLEQIKGKSRVTRFAEAELNYILNEMGQDIR